MAYDLPPIEGDDNLGDTIPNDPESTRAMPVTRSEIPQGGHVAPIGNPAPRRSVPPAQGVVRAPMSRQPARPRKPAHDNALYLPWWSLVLMLLVVMLTTFLIVGGIYIMGGTGVVSATQEPIVRIITAVPTDVNLSNTNPGTNAVNVPSTQVITSSTGTDLALTGPTLAPVVFTPTPQAITIGSAVVVTGVGAQALNVRDNAGTLTTNVIFRVEDGTRFIVVDGPTQADGFTWWQVQDVNNASQTGWAVSNYLSVVGDE